MTRRIPPHTKVASPIRISDRTPIRICESIRTKSTNRRTKTCGSDCFHLTSCNAYARTTCEHTREHGEATTWPRAAELEHFDRCLTPTARLRLWEDMRSACDRATRCLAEDHAALLASQLNRPDYSQVTINAADLEHTPDLLSVIRDQIRRNQTRETR